MAEPHRFTTRIYYEDTDAGGIVYHANHLKFAERARTELLREWGVNQSTLRAESGIGFVVGDCHIRYLKPIRLDDVIDVLTTIEEVKKVRVTLRQNIMRHPETVAEIRAILICVNQEGRATPIPDVMLRTFSQHLLTGAGQTC